MTFQRTQGRDDILPSKSSESSAFYLDLKASTYWPTDRLIELEFKSIGLCAKYGYISF